MNEILVEITPPIRQLTLHLRWGILLLGLPKSVSNQWDLSLNIIFEVFRCVSLAFCEFQSVEHKLERIFGESRDEGALLSGIQSQSVLGGLQR